MKITDKRQELNKDIQEGSIIEYMGKTCIVSEDRFDDDIKCLIDLATGEMVFKEECYLGDLDDMTEITDISTQYDVELVITNRGNN